jgi:hypothetical protein
MGLPRSRRGIHHETPRPRQTSAVKTSPRCRPLRRSAWRQGSESDLPAPEFPIFPGDAAEKPSADRAFASANVSSGQEDREVRRAPRPGLTERALGDALGRRGRACVHRATFANASLRLDCHAGSLANPRERSMRASIGCKLGRTLKGPCTCHGSMRPYIRPARISHSHASPSWVVMPRASTFCCSRSPWVC